jgi:hypothetical protein
MNPTPRLRWIERPLANFEIDEVFPQGNFSYKPRKLRILQQWFAYDIEYPITKGEWRDVPLEKEHE